MLAAVAVIAAVVTSVIVLTTNRTDNAVDVDRGLSALLLSWGFTWLCRLPGLSG